jgi:hypothetical protein
MFHPSVVGYSAWADVIAEALLGHSVDAGAMDSQSAPA